MNKFYSSEDEFNHDLTTLKGFSHRGVATILKTASLLETSLGKPDIFESGCCRYGAGRRWRGGASHMYLYLLPGGCRKKFNMLNSRQQSKMCAHSCGQQPLHGPTAVETASPLPPFLHWNDKKRRVAARGCEKPISVSIGHQFTDFQN